MADDKTPDPMPEPRAIFVRMPGGQSAGDPLVQAFKTQSIPASADGEISSMNVESLHGSQAWITPTIDFEVLEERVRASSILPPLVDAMEANVDGTGWELVPKDVDKENDDATKKQAKDLSAFFEEPWPGVSFDTIRKSLRRNYEETGNAALEVLRNPAGKVVFARWLDVKTLRMLQLDDAVPVEKTLERNGAKVTIKIDMRERRFVQIPRRTRLSSGVDKPAAGGDLDSAGPAFTVYFKEFGATRDLDAKDGEWAPKDERLPFKQRASEIIWWTNKPDVGTPYGLPRWISNTPSVIGHRDAEEFNLEFFDSGGVPPLLLIISGGRMAEEAEKMLTKQFMSSGPNRHSAAILEAYATGGDIDSPQNVKVTVERFGSERMTDSMFENYMAQCDNRIRRSFRLPAIFLGNGDDMSFATAFASYTVAEAQVFGPERDEFDEKINLLLMPELEGGKDFLYHSLPLAVRDVAQQLKGLELIAEKITGESMVSAVSQVTDLTVRSRDDLDDLDNIALETAQAGLDGAKASAEGTRAATAGNEADRDNGAVTGRANRKGLPSGSEPVRAVSTTKGTGIAALAEDAIQALLSRDVEALRDARAKVATLPALDHNTFSHILAATLFPEMHHDPQGARELAACTFALMAAHAEE
jgi:PBSX family phage portal protein